jgi:diacylglycerol kinase family enzyme
MIKPALLIWRPAVRHPDHHRNAGKLKAALGGVSYLIHGLMRMDTLKPDRCEIRGENFHWQGDALVIGIGNGAGRRRPAAMPGGAD